MNWTLGVGLCLCLFSNSFVVEEAQVLSFAVSTTLALMLLKTPRGHHRKLFVGAVLATAGLVRLGGLYFRCREEQQGHCSPTDFHKPIGNLPQDVSRAYKNWRFFFTISSGKRATAEPGFFFTTGKKTETKKLRILKKLRVIPAKKLRLSEALCNVPGPKN